MRLSSFVLRNLLCPRWVLEKLPLKTNPSPAEKAIKGVENEVRRFNSNLLLSNIYPSPTGGGQRNRAYSRV